MVRRTNHRDVEKVLLQRESFCRTIRLILEGAYEADEPRLSSVTRQLYLSCPQVLNNLLQPTQYSHDILNHDDDDQDDEDDHRPFWNSPEHRQLSFSHSIPAKKVLERMRIPVRLSTLPNLHPFLKELRHAYAQDYKKNSVLEPGPNPLKWFSKLSYSVK